MTDADDAQSAKDLPLREDTRLLARVLHIALIGVIDVDNLECFTGSSRVPIGGDGDHPQVCCLTRFERPGRLPPSRRFPQRKGLHHV
jgi:hypothetical protein